MAELFTEFYLQISDNIFTSGTDYYFSFQPIGFFVLVIGMFLYNDVIILPFLRRREWCGLSREQDDDLVPVYIKSGCF